MEAFETEWEKNGGGICGKQSCEKYWRASFKLMHSKFKVMGIDALIAFVENELKE